MKYSLDIDLARMLHYSALVNGLINFLFSTLSIIEKKANVNPSVR